MAIIRRVTRIANPRKRRKAAKRVARKRSAPAIKRYSVKALKKELRKRGVKANPRAKRRVVKRRKAVKRSNPMLIEFGALNPHKRRKSVARKRKVRRSSNPRRRAVARVTHRRRRRSNRRRRNPVVAVTKNRRRRHARRANSHRRHHIRRRRNPMGFGSKQLLEMSSGMLIGVAAAKYIPTILPASVTTALPATSFTAPLITAASTFLAYWGGSKFLPGDVAKGIALGGAALTLSQVLNVIAPPNISGPLALAGVGDIVPTMGFSVPDRSMRAPVVQMPMGTGVGRYRRLAR